MYCPSCELEIKGEDQEKCPICETPLIQSPFKETLQEGGTSDDDLKLKELIEDIDGKVKKDQDEDAAEGELVLEGIEQKDEEPSEDEFKLDLEDKKPDIQIETSEEQAFVLDGEEKKAEPEVSPITEGGVGKEVIEKRKDEGTEEAPKLEEIEVGGIAPEGIKEQKEAEDIIPEEPVGAVPAEEAKVEKEKEIGGKVEAVEEVQIEEPVSEPLAAAEEKTTEDILDKALDELDAAGVKEPPPKRRSLAKSIMWIILPLIVVIGGGYFYLEYMSKPSPVPETGVKVVKKEAKVLKKLLKKDEEKALKQEKLAVTAKKTEAVEKKVVKEKPVAEEKEPVVTAKKAEPPKEKAPAAKPAVKKEKEPVKKAEVKKEAEVKKKAEVPPPITYAIHAGSYRKKKSADAEARRLKKKGFDAYVERTDLTKLGKKGIWFRVKIGRFSSREEARKMQKELKRKDKISSRVIRNRPL